MAVKRKTLKLRQGDIIDVEEYHDGNYGAKGKKREKKKKPTKEEVQKVNERNRVNKARLRLLQYFSPGDCFATWTYEKSKRPEDMKEALQHFQKAIRKVREQYRKKGYELFWIRNIEKGTKGAWHIHLVVNEIGDTAGILKNAWKHGGTYTTEIQLSDKLYDEDFTKLAAYITKNEKTEELKEDGTPAKPRIKEASYNISKNMPLPEPKVDKLVRWKQEPESKKGYYLLRVIEGINPVTGFKYRRYTMAKLHKEVRKREKGKPVYRNRQSGAPKKKAPLRLRP